MLDTEKAKFILNDPEYKEAWIYWNRKPMETSDRDFALAMDWSEALLCLSAATEVKS